MRHRHILAPSCRNQAEWIQAPGVTLPAAVRPWLKLWHKGDAVTLAATRVPGAEAMPQEEPTPPPTAIGGMRPSASTPGTPPDSRTHLHLPTTFSVL